MFRCKKEKSASSEWSVPCTLLRGGGRYGTKEECWLERKGVSLRIKGFSKEPSNRDPKGGDLLLGAAHLTKLSNSDGGPKVPH